MLHTTGGYAVGAAATFKYVFDYQEGEVYWCTADCGWITGHSYVTYGGCGVCVGRVVRGGRGVQVYRVLRRHSYVTYRGCGNGTGGVVRGL